MASNKSLASKLDRLTRATPKRRLTADPVEFPHRYSDPRDIEVAALLSASLAYGRVDLFRPKLEWLFAKMGGSPAQFVQALEVPAAAKMLEGFVYRFNVPADLAVLLMGMGQALRRHGSLEALFLKGLNESKGQLRPALSAFTRALSDVPLPPIVRAMGKTRGLHHLLPTAEAGAQKRLNLFLRWMVRGPDEVDFGIWKRVPKNVLVVPLDTHIMRMALNLGFTKRRTVGWKTAEEITTALRGFDGEDPVRFDFALCHFGMSGSCPAKPQASLCRKCELLPECTVGPKVVRRAK